MWIIILIIIIGVALLTISENKKKKKRQLIMEEKISSMSDFVPSQKIVGVEDFYTFMIDDTHEQICYLDSTQKHIIPYDKIIKVELIEDGTTISSKSTMRTIGGTLVGGMLAGGVGAVVGGLSGNSKNLKKVSAIQVKISIRDLNVPSITIDAFNARTMTTDGKPIKPDGLSGYLYQKGISDANKIVDLITFIIDKIDHKSNNSEISTQTTISIASEIQKLAELKNQGILTQEEFDSQKAKLLNG